MKRITLYDVKTWFEIRKINLQYFWQWHRDEILILAPVVIGGTVKIVKVISKKSTAKLQKDNKERFIYDRSEGHYWELKRPLRNDEWQYISSEKNKGRRYADILLELNVLK